MPPTPKQTLADYLQIQRDALVWKAQGLSERQLRWPITPSGSNILGIIKHVASVEFGYFGDTFDRPASEPMPWFDDDAEDNADMWATPEQTREWVLDFYRRAWAHSDATIAELDLDARGRVPWWPAERADVTLHQILVHMTVETARHAGHVDILRELSDGEVGWRRDSSSLPPGDAQWWAGYVARLRQIAEEA